MTVDPRGGAVGPQRWVEGWRRRFLAAGMFSYPIVTAASIPQYTHGWSVLLAGYTFVVAFCVHSVLATVALARGARQRFWVYVTVTGALIVAVLPFAHANAFFLASVVASLVVLGMRRYAAAVVIAGTLVVLVVPWVLWPDEGPGWIEAITLVFTVLTVFAFAEIASANRALVEARAEVAQLASDAERSRIARDLHDLLGHSLTAITVKSALARRLASQPEVSREIADVERLSRQALTEVRAAVSGFGQVTLAGELARGRELLRAADIVADLPTSTDPVDASHQELLGWAVREGITNVVRHARASRCTVTLSTSGVDIVDDGRGATDTPGPGGGHGLSGLRDRVEAAGGRVEVGPVDPRGWRLRVALDGRGAAA